MKCHDVIFDAGQIYTDSPETATLLGLLKQRSSFSPVQELKELTDFK